MTRPTLALLLALPLAGCGAIETIEDPVWAIEPEDSLVVMPFKDPDFRSRWDSPQGSETAMRTTEALQRECDFRVQGYESILELYQSPELSQFGPRDVARNTGADFVLVCDMEEFRLQDPLSVNIKQGYARIKVRLFEVEERDPADEEQRRLEMEQQNRNRALAGLPPVEFDRGGRFIADAERTVEARYPSDFYTPGGEAFMDDEEIRAGLTLVMARKVAQLYYPHPKENIETE